MNKFETQLQQIVNLRELKGRETETLDMITALEPEILAADDHHSLCLLYWEKAFVYQHLFMDGVDKDTNLKFMEEAAMSAHRVVDKYNIEELRGDDYRFLGRVCDYQNNYVQSEVYYRQALEFYENLNHPRVLEIKGFLAANLINQSKVDEGLALAKNVYKQFDDSPVKQTDYYTWAVWKTGIYPRIVNALANQNAIVEGNEIQGFLEDSRNLLANPQGEITWGDKSFQFRLDEIDQALKSLQN